MLPYFELHVIHLGPLPIQVWGFFVALGIVLGTWIVARVGKERGLSPSLIWDASFWVILGAIIGARLLFVFSYASLEIFTNPLSLFALWDGGMSIMGGFFGAVAMGVWYLRKHGADVWAYANAGVFGLPFGLAIGRVGCFLIHDHPGTASHFFLAVQNPSKEGGFHDLGLYDVFVCVAIALLFLFLRYKKALPGLYVPLFLILYGFARFWLDFFRILDARYFGLTPAQYLAVAMGIVGVCILVRSREVLCRGAEKNVLH